MTNISTRTLALGIAGLLAAGAVAIAAAATIHVDHHEAPAPLSTVLDTTDRGVEITGRAGRTATTTTAVAADAYPALPAPQSPVMEGSWTDQFGNEWPAICQFGVDQLEHDFGFTNQQGINARTGCNAG